MAFQSQGMSQYYSSDLELGHLFNRGRLHVHFSQSHNNCVNYSCLNESVKVGLSFI